MDNLTTMRSLLADVLSSDPADITPEANLIRDLAAESIDFIDIAFQIEQKFGIPDVKPATMFPVFLRDLPEIFADGKLIPEIKQQLIHACPFLKPETLDRFEAEKSFEIFFDVSTLLDFVEYQHRTVAASPAV